MMHRNLFVSSVLAGGDHVGAYVKAGMRVLAVTLGRPSRPRHDDHIHHITRKEEARGLIDDQCSKKNDDRGVGEQRSNGKDTVLRYKQDLSGRSEEKTVSESSKRLICADQNESKSARVIRVPRETMSAHRSKLVRNSSINKWRAKFRRQPLTSETATETDTVQLLGETEKNVRAPSKPELGVRDARSLDEKTKGHNPPLSLNDDYKSNKRNNCSNFLYMAKNKSNAVLSNDTTGTGARQETMGRESSGVSSNTPEEWSSGSPPRCVTPHRVQLRGEFIPWVGPISERDSDSPRYLPMNGGHTSSALNTPHLVGHSSASCHRASSAARPPRATSQEHVSSWPRPSRASTANTEEGVYKAPSELCPRAVCPPSPASDLVRSNAPSGSNSQFGTFPRRRLSQKGKYAVSSHCFN